MNTDMAQLITVLGRLVFAAEKGTFTKADYKLCVALLIPLEKKYRSGVAALAEAAETLGA